MKLEQLYYLTEAIKYESISIAARKNYISQSTFSSSITRLEKELNTSLLKRTHQGIKPTKTGLEVAEKSMKIFSIMDEIRLCAGDSRDKLLLNVATMPSLVDTVLADMILSIEKDQVPLKVNVITGDQESIVQSVQLGQSDLGIIFTDEPIKSPKITYHKLFQDSFCLFVGKDSPLYQKESVTMEEALVCPHIAYNTEYRQAEDVLTQLVYRYGKPEVAFRVDNTESMRRLISKSEYVAFFPHFTIQHDAYIESGKVKALPISNANLNIYIGYIESDNFKDSQGNELFFSLLKKVIEENDLYHTS